jgi:hypothetical protein
MPVLDAKALKTDPKGAAFLLSVLRRSPAPAPKAEAKPNSVRTHPAKPQDELVQGGASGA